MNLKKNKDGDMVGFTGKKGKENYVIILQPQKIKEIIEK